MDNFVEFISDNYVWFLVVTIFLIFALIGYFYDIKHSDVEFTKEEPLPSDMTEGINIQADKPINDMVNNASTTPEETTGVNLQTDDTNIN